MQLLVYLEKIADYSAPRVVVGALKGAPHVGPARGEGTRAERRRARGARARRDPPCVLTRCASRPRAQTAHASSRASAKTHATWPSAPAAHFANAARFRFLFGFDVVAEGRFGIALATGRSHAGLVGVVRSVMDVQHARLAAARATARNAFGVFARRSPSPTSSRPPAVLGRPAEDGLGEPPRSRASFPRRVSRRRAQPPSRDAAAAAARHGSSRCPPRRTLARIAPLRNRRNRRRCRSPPSSSSSSRVVVEGGVVAAKGVDVSRRGARPRGALGARAAAARAVASRRLADARARTRRCFANDACVSIARGVQARTASSAASIPKTSTPMVRSGSVRHPVARAARGRGRLAVARVRPSPSARSSATVTHASSSRRARRRFRRRRTPSSRAAAANAFWMRGIGRRAEGARRRGPRPRPRTPRRPTGSSGRRAGRGTRGGGRVRAPVARTNARRPSARRTTRTVCRPGAPSRPPPRRSPRGRPLPPPGRARPRRRDERRREPVVRRDVASAGPGARVFF